MTHNMTFLVDGYGITFRRKLGIMDMTALLAKHYGPTAPIGQALVNSLIYGREVPTGPVRWTMIDDLVVTPVQKVVLTLAGTNLELEFKRRQRKAAAEHLQQVWAAVEHKTGRRTAPNDAVEQPSGGFLSL